jgi:hypothetical protein
MRPLVVSALSISLVALTSVAFAQAPASDQDHAAHHPAGASAPASGVKTPPVKAKTTPAKPKAAPAAASAGMGMGMGMGKMHDEAHKPGGMHEQMHGKDNKMMGGPMSGMPVASAASK